MPCPAPEKLADLARGRLSKAAAKEIEIHLEACDSCRRALKAEKAFHGALQVTIRESDLKEAELLSMAAEDRRPSRRWTINGVALTLGLAASLLLTLFLFPRISFEEALVLRHLEEGKMEVQGGREAVAKFVPARLELNVAFHDNLNYQGARMVQIKKTSAAQILLKVGNERVSLFIFSTEGMGDLKDGAFYDHTVAIERGRLAAAVVGRIGLDEARSILAPFRGN